MLNAEIQISDDLPTPVASKGLISMEKPEKQEDYNKVIPTISFTKEYWSVFHSHKKETIMNKIDEKIKDIEKSNAEINEKLKDIPKPKEQRSNALNSLPLLSSSNRGVKDYTSSREDLGK